MRTRDKSYCDYGFSLEVSKALRQYIRSRDFRKSDLLLECCYRSNAEIGAFLYESLLNGLSYERLSGREYIPICRNDFYAYQRKALALFHENLIAE